MTEYAIEVSATAEKQLRKLNRKDQVRVVRAIRKLAIEPRAPGVRRIRGYDDVYRARVGKYRIIFSIEDRRLIIIVLKIGYRRDIYHRHIS